ncbi:MAG TPA: septum formation initiator family protein [Enhygromyxa sp.]|nr:septum formation initiator family protein [Enhygromyxa sp.]
MIGTRRSRSRSRESAPIEPQVAVVTLPRSRRRSSNDGLAAQRRNRAQQKAIVEDSRPHGWGRADDPDFALPSKPSFLDRRRADGTPLLLFTVLAVLTGVGLAQVDSRLEILQLANEITELSEEQQRLLDRKRRLETERAYLRRPARISEQARERLGMEPAPSDRIQRIELLPAKAAEPAESESESQR